MADDSYKTIKQVAEGYYTEKRSRFISYAIPVRTVEEVKEQLEKYRKQYYDARHVCWAYMLGPERQTFRANDDGEPSSTAGKPILGQINSNELTDLLIVVVRYFGGIELGTSGLIVAYRTAAAEAIAAAEIEEPLTAVLVGVVHFGEGFDLDSAAGLILVVTAVIIVILQTNHTPRTPPANIPPTQPQE